MKLIATLIVMLTWFSALADDWVAAYRVAYVADAATTWDVLQNSNKYELNPWFCKMSAEEAAFSVLAVNWIQERIVTGIKDKKLRSVVGWALTYFEFDMALGNVKARFPVRW